jgi:CO dehydrogenase maturation factor
MRLEEAVLESGDCDLIVMGQPEGQGCYCAANSLLTNFLDRLQDNYPYIVTDNEAGMEHISRMTTKNVDVLLIVTDASRRGLQAALRINELSQSLNVGVGKTFVIINQIKSEPPDQALEMLSEAGVELGGVLPEDDAVYDYDFKGKPMIELPDDNPVVQAAFDIFEKIMETETVKASADTV